MILAKTSTSQHHSPRSRRTTREPVVPMINVVFLLLIFFLMTAQIVPPAPFDLTLPEARGEEHEGRDVLYIDASGQIAYGAERADAALAAAAAAAATNDTPLQLQADARLDAAVLANVLAQLARMGTRRVDIITEGG